MCKLLNSSILTDKVIIKETSFYKLFSYKIVYCQIDCATHTTCAYHM